MTSSISFVDRPVIPMNIALSFTNTSHASEEPERGSAAEDDHLVTLRTAR
jgi:hypothetical protein